MNVHRGLLFWGLALVIAGAIPLAVGQGILAREPLGEIWRFWPLVLVALGVALILSRTPLAVVGTLLAALVIGTAAGAALALGPGIAAGCGVGEPGATHTAEGGLPDDAAAVEVNFNCGSLDVGLADEDGWQLAAAGNEPRVDEQGARLRIATADTIGFGASRQRWDLQLPAGPELDLQVDANAAQARVDLAGGSLSRLAASLNAGDFGFELSGARVDAIRIGLNAGSVSISTDAETELAGRLEVNAGSIELCAPADATMAIQLDTNITFGHNLGDAGLTEERTDQWRRGEGTPAIDLRVSGNAASFDLRDEEACQR